MENSESVFGAIKTLNKKRIKESQESFSETNSTSSKTSRLLDEHWTVACLRRSVFRFAKERKTANSIGHLEMCC